MSDTDYITLEIENEIKRKVRLYVSYYGVRPETIQLPKAMYRFLNIYGGSGTYHWEGFQVRFINGGWINAIEVF